LGLRHLIKSVSCRHY